MKFQVEIVSKDIVKPSSPTPIHLQTHKLSFLDQASPSIFIPLVLFFPADDTLSISERSNHLKRSFSQALTQFYPLAGRLVDKSNINCHDEGVIYVEARVRCNLSEVMNNPIPAEINKLLPYDPDEVTSHRGLVSLIQVNFFDCGGVAIGVTLSHHIADAKSLIMFINSWAAFSRGDRHIPSPVFESATLFPPRDVSSIRRNTNTEPQITKRFVFTASKIAELRGKYTKNAEGENPTLPTRVEALSAFIWVRFMAATKAKDDPNKICTLVHAVNLRGRTDPPLSEHYFGNIYLPAIAIPSLESDEESGYDIVNKLRDAISSLGGDYITKFQEGDKHLNFMKDRLKEVSKGKVVSLNFTSWCRFPLYAADFGWGKPLWVAPTSFNIKNLVIFLDSQSGDGIEAWLILREDDMEKLEADEKFLEFVS